MCTNLDNWAAIWGTLFHLGVVGAAVLENGLVVVDVCDENDNHGSADVRSLVTFHAAGTVVNSSYIQLIPKTNKIISIFSCNHTFFQAYSVFDYFFVTNESVQILLLTKVPKLCFD